MTNFLTKSGFRLSQMISVLPNCNRNHYQ